MKVTTQKKTFNGYLAADVTLILAVVVFALFFVVKTKSIAISAGLLGMLSFAIFVIQATKGDTTVINQSGNAICATDEETTTKGGAVSRNVCAVPNNSTVSGIDGIKVYEQVYKIPDGVHATVTKNGSVRIHSFLFGQIMYKGLGGKRSITDFSDYDRQTWKPLFDYEL